MTRGIVRLLRIIGSLVLALAVLVAGTAYYAYRDYKSPPRILLINASGAPVSHIAIRINRAEVAVEGVLQDGERVERMVSFRGGEGSTTVSWVDKTGMPHQGNGNDYVESTGGYRTTLVIHPDNTLSQPAPRPPPVEPVPRPDRPR